MIGLCLIFLSLFSVAFSGSRAEVLYIQSWAAQVLHSYWDLTQDYCTWEGFTCDADSNLVSIQYSCSDTSPILMGPLPPIDLWTRAFYNQTAFQKTNSISFTYCLLGPLITDEFATTWINGYPLNFNFSTSIGSTPMFSCPLPEGLPEEITCSPTTIIKISPSEGSPIAGGNFTATMNKQANFARAACRFTYENGASSTVVVPATVGWIGPRSTLTCRVPAGEDPFKVDIVVDGEVITNAQPSFTYGYACPPGTGGTPCTECPVGTFKSSYGPECIPTPIGAFQSEAGATEVILCPAGTVTPGNGSTSIADCSIICPAGTFSSENGCEDCLPGFFSLGNTRECTACPAGWTSLPAADVCTPCLQGEGFNGSACAVCPPSTFAAVPGVPCTPCQEGFTNNDINTACQKCPGGFYRLSTMKECQLCPPGTFSNETKGNAFCTVCQIGWYAEGEGNTECTECPDGRTTLYTGQDSCFSSSSGVGGDENHRSFVAGIVLTAIGGSFLLISLLVLIIFFCWYYPKEAAELEGINSQMGDLAKSST